MMSGSISVKSEVGKGTVFSVVIPIEIAREQNISIKKNEATDLVRERLANIDILLVEDNEFNRIVAEDTIMDYLKDVTMEHAENGKRAVEMVSENDYDLVLMDIQMPEMDGYEATRTIRMLNGDKKNTPIMAMTANATPEEINKCFESGMNEYISKPFVPEDLFNKMASLMSKVQS